MNKDTLQQIKGFPNEFHLTNHLFNLFATAYRKLPVYKIQQHTASVATPGQSLTPPEHGVAQV
ncbi:hypothetical protein Pcar_3433 [Syntrophotalea carbinolica DSM 2380]|uniref:Uncharacterized protein n=1 Tax=Syntrophotalea carbinolica (strain DSM 2380 / NBRC 103641 / GraBd1) TaxID=338963 RepID=J9U3Y3_SYNC1|nr:hypothetical protein Pcar_3433 [Syntrophotalea carbinolica DSM 2380]